MTQQGRSARVSIASFPILLLATQDNTAQLTWVQIDTQKISQRKQSNGFIKIDFPCRRSPVETKLYSVSK